MANALRLAPILLAAAALAAQTLQPAATIGPAAPVTVAQLQQLLAANRQHDTALAAHLDSLELTQRLSLAQLDTLRTALPGNRSRDALTVLADRSLFLAAPPAADLPPPPDLAEQRRIMALTVDYVSAAVHKLPNFYAARATTQFVDWPKNLQVGVQVSAHNIPLEALDTVTDTVTYREGKEEVRAPRPQHLKRGVHPAEGLQTRGVFGPILTVVLLDAAHGSAAWDRWERADTPAAGPPALVAVYRYTVPMKSSTYFVTYCCMHGADNFFAPIDRHSEYHGEIAVDAATGAILRITVIADLERGDTAALLDEAAHGDPLLQADLAVEYGVVSIGSIAYTCPIRSVAISRIRTQSELKIGTSTLLTTGPVRTYLNHVTFTDYHLFRSDSRILLPDNIQP